MRRLKRKSKHAKGSTNNRVRDTIKLSSETVPRVSTNESFGGSRQSAVMCFIRQRTLSAWLMSNICRFSSVVGCRLRVREFRRFEPRSHHRKDVYKRYKSAPLSGSRRWKGSTGFFPWYSRGKGFHHESGVESGYCENFFYHQPEINERAFNDLH